MRCGRTYRWTRMHRHRALFRELGTFFAVRSWAGCITNMFGFDLRQAQAPPPLLNSDPEIRPAGIRRLIGKFDPAARDERNRTLGKAGEEFVVDFERRRLTRAGRADLARDVRWVA